MARSCGQRLPGGARCGGSGIGVKAANAAVIRGASERWGSIGKVLKMELLKQMTGEAGWCLGFQPDGRELLVVAAKVTFDLLPDGAEPTLAKEQAPLTKGAEFTGDPGYSATRYESDYAHRKPLCDVLVNGSAYAPHGDPAEKGTVGLLMVAVEKRFQ